MICTKCQVENIATEFYTRKQSKSGYQPWCKQCMIMNMKERYKNMPNVNQGIKDREKIHASIFLNISSLIKTKYGCQSCYEKCPCVLQFHHIDPKNKDEAVSAFCFKKSKMKFFNEINKCIVLCANCHLKVHFQLINQKNFILCNEDINNYCYNTGSIWKWKNEFKNEIQEYQRK